jgi:hypothetical protein
MSEHKFGKWLTIIVLPLALATQNAQAFNGSTPKPSLLVMDGAGAEGMILKVACEEPPEVIIPISPALLQSVYDSGDCKDTEPTSPGVSKAVTDQIVKAIRDADRTCSDMRLVPEQKGVDERLYRIDCYRLMYRKLADGLPKRGDYAPMRRALLDASDKLNGIVRANQDTSADKIKVRERAKPAAPATAPIRAIRPDRIDVAQAQAEAVIQETAIVILRSGEIPTRRNVHYAEVSAAVEDSLVVLRSA